MKQGAGLFCTAFLLVLVSAIAFAGSGVERRQRPRDPPTRADSAPAPGARLNQSVQLAIAILLTAPLSAAWRLVVASLLSDSRHGARPTCSPGSDETPQCISSG